jgi:ribokinase
MATSATVVVIGSTMIDMTTYSRKIPQAGETIIGDTFALGHGGKGANQAVMARRLGATVHLVNALGDDVFGDTAMENLQAQGIDTSLITRVAGASGMAAIWVEPDGTNRIICVPGANNAMTAQQARSAVERFTATKVVIGQLEIPQEVTIAAFAAARARGIITVLNPAPFAPLHPELAHSSDWIIPNEAEFAGLHPAGLGPDSDSTIRELAESLGCRFAVTLGERGAAYCGKSGEIFHVKAPSVLAVDTTGAGDAFVGAFAFGLASGMTAGDAALLGCLCASDSVTRLGAQSSYPGEAQARQLLAQVHAR